MHKGCYKTTNRQYMNSLINFWHGLLTLADIIDKLMLPAEITLTGAKKNLYTMC